jgi:hypothetical protein
MVRNLHKTRLAAGLTKLIPALAVGGALALPASASAAHKTFCGHPGFPYISLYATGVSCRTARTVERYWAVGHNTLLSPTARIAGRTWTFHVNRHPGGFVWVSGQRLQRELTRATSGKRTVAIYSPPYG